MKRVFALDANFPWVMAQIDWPTDAELDVIPIQKLHPDLTDATDPSLILELARRGTVDGIITNDTGMLAQAHHMVALQATHLTLIVPSGKGHRPLVATGLVLVYIERIARSWRPQAQVALITPTSMKLERPKRFLDEIARHGGVSTSQLVLETRRELGVFLPTGEEIARAHE